MGSCCPARISRAGSAKLKNLLMEVTFTSNRRQTQTCSTWQSFLFTSRLLTCSFLHLNWQFHTQFFIDKNCVELFYLLIFYFEKFSTWICRLPYTWGYPASSVHKNAKKKELAHYPAVLTLRLANNSHVFSRYFTVPTKLFVVVPSVQIHNLTVNF